MQINTTTTIQQTKNYNSKNYYKSRREREKNYKINDKISMFVFVDFYLLQQQKHKQTQTMNEIK